jgi:hypothetical protein
MCLERGPLSVVSTTEELLGRKGSGFGLENRDYGRRDPSRWPRGSIYPQKFALTSATSCGRSVGIVRSGTQTTEWKSMISFLNNFCWNRFRNDEYLSCYGSELDRHIFFIYHASSFHPRLQNKEVSIHFSKLVKSKFYGSLFSGSRVVSLRTRAQRMTSRWRISENNLTILKRVNLIYKYIYIYIYDRLCGLVVRVLGYRSGGPGSIHGTTRKKSSVSGTGSTQPREYNWGAAW